MQLCHARGPMKVVNMNSSRDNKQKANNKHYLRPKLDVYNKKNHNKNELASEKT